MFIFAHIFAGALLGRGLWHLTNDRRAIITCITGSILPDLTDKSLGLFFPSVLGSGRTVFHALASVCILLVILLMFVRSIHRLPLVGIACAFFLHQVLDEMWTQPSNWFYPFLGPFKGYMIQDYIGTYFWFEITNPGEWLFFMGTVMILAVSFPEMVRIPFLSLWDRVKTRVYVFIIVIFGGIGLCLVAAGLLSPADTVITPLYHQVTNVMTGLLFLIGAVLMSWEKYNSRL